VPKRASELGACKELEGQIFTIGSGNEEKMVTYIGTKYGDEAAQEWTSEKRIMSNEPNYSDAIEIRHAERVRATKERLNRKLTSLTAKLKAIDEEIKQDPNNRDLKKERREIDEKILKCEIDLKYEVEMKLTEDEKMAHSNAWRSHCETTEGQKKSRGKVYLLLLGQCTQVLVDKMKQDATWTTVS
jgi:hypothetical protein